MKQTIITPAGPVSVGTHIRIVSVLADVVPSRAFPDGVDHQARAMEGREGTVTAIDDLPQLHGTWGGLAVNPECDRFVIVRS